MNKEMRKTMSKPDAAERFKHDWDLSEISIEEAMQTLGSRWFDDRVVLVRYIAKVSRVALLWATKTLDPYGIAVRTIDDYEPDEWSLVAETFVNTPEPKVERAEIWSPGA